MTTFHLIISNRQTYSSFWPKLLNIYTFLWLNFFILCHLMEMILPNKIGEKSRLFRRFLQYYVICYFSKYIRLALTDFRKNKVFYRKCMWLQLRQLLKKIHRRKREKIYCPCFLCSCWRNKNRKTLMFSFERVCWLLELSSSGIC